MCSVQFIGYNLNMVQNHHNDVLVVLDEVACINKDLVNENRILREDMKRRDKEQKMILTDLHNKIQEVTSENNRCTSRRPPQKHHRSKFLLPVG